jgi:hypothetical protein
MSQDTRKLLQAHRSMTWGLLFVPLGLIVIAALIALLTSQAGIVGATAGVALVGLSSFVTTRLVRRYPEPGGMPAIATPSPPSTPGWLKLVNVGVEVWTDTAEWLNASSPVPSAPSSTVSQGAIAILDQVPGMTAAHPRDFIRAIAVARLQDGSTLRTWKNPVGFDHVFLADPNHQMIYGGYVGWIHSGGLQKAIVRIKRELT